jgi:release factor glutamine methyltransferase
MKSLRKRVFYDELAFEVFDEVYQPAEDTFLAADALTQIVKRGDKVLDVGTGCGILAIVAARKAGSVVATDLNPHAIKCARLNARNNGVAGRVEVRRGDLFQTLRKTEKFDVIVFNAPYLPTSEKTTWIERAWAGGPTGRELIDRFIVEVRRYLRTNGEVLLIQSSLANIDETLAMFRELSFDTWIRAENKVAFEKIVVVQASHLSSARIKK